MWYKNVGTRFFVLSQIMRLTDSQTGGPTVGRTDSFIVTRPPCIQCSAVKITAYSNTQQETDNVDYSKTFSILILKLQLKTLILIMAMLQLSDCSTVVVRINVLIFLHNISNQISCLLVLRKVQPVAFRNRAIKAIFFVFCDKMTQSRTSVISRDYEYRNE